MIHEFVTSLEIQKAGQRAVHVSQLFICVFQASSACVLQSSAATSSYSLCQDLLSNSAYKLYWSLDTASSPVLLTGAVAGTTDGWLGFGFPAVAGEMVGGNAIIAKPCSTCSSGEIRLSDSHFYLLMA